LVAYWPISSFFFASALIAGWPATKDALTWSLM
jgi:hypothetical protein